MSLLMCPHCGLTFVAVLVNHLIPVHSYVPEGQTQAVPCPGSRQTPRNADSDKRPLWKDGGVQ